MTIELTFQNFLPDKFLLDWDDKDVEDRQKCAWQMLARVRQCVAVCCSVLQSVAVCCSVLQCL